MEGNEIIRELVVLQTVWNHRQTCLNQPEQNEISKAKAHVYGICADELKNLLKKTIGPALKEQPSKEMTDEEFETLKAELEYTMGALNKLQRKYIGQTGTYYR